MAPPNYATYRPGMMKPKSNILRSAGRGILVSMFSLSVYFSGVIANEYVAMKKAEQTYSQVALEKSNLYSKINEINKLLPVVKDELKTQYNTEKASLLEKTVALDGQFLSAHDTMQKRFENDAYSWVAFFK